MYFIRKRTFVSAILSILVFGNAGFATAQSARGSENWITASAQNPTTCWAVAVPEKTVNTPRPGRTSPVQRGDIFLMVFYEPSARSDAHVYFNGGYPFSPGSTVDVNIDGTLYRLITRGEEAWPPSLMEDGQVVAAMKRGAKAVFTASSARGTKTEDTFSLIGFTAALAEAQRRCGL